MWREAGPLSNTRSSAQQRLATALAAVASRPASRGKTASRRVWMQLGGRRRSHPSLRCRAWPARCSMRRWTRCGAGWRPSCGLPWRQQRQQQHHHQRQRQQQQSRVRCQLPTRGSLTLSASHRLSRAPQRSSTPTQTPPRDPATTAATAVAAMAAGSASAARAARARAEARWRRGVVALAPRGARFPRAPSHPATYQPPSTRHTRRASAHPWPCPRPTAAGQVHTP